MDVTLTVTVSLQYLDVENSVWWTEDRKESRFELFYLLTLILIMRNIINDKYRKNIFEHRSKQSREREITPNKKNNTNKCFRWGEYIPRGRTQTRKLYKRLRGGGCVLWGSESAAPAQVRRRRSDGCLRYLNYAGRIRHKTTWRIL